MDLLFSVILLSSGNMMPADPDQDPAPQWTLDLDYIVLLPEQQDCVLCGGTTHTLLNSWHIRIRTP